MPPSEVRIFESSGCVADHGPTLEDVFCCCCCCVVPADEPAVLPISSECLVVSCVAPEVPAPGIRAPFPERRTAGGSQGTWLSIPRGLQLASRRSLRSSHSSPSLR